MIKILDRWLFIRLESLGNVVVGLALTSTHMKDKNSDQSYDHTKNEFSIIGCFGAKNNIL